MRAIVMGIGPIGGIIGGRLARAGQDVTFVDVDREHVEAIRENGLQVDVPDGAFNVKANVVFPDEIEGAFDAAFIAVRCNYTRDTLAAVLPHLNEDGLIVSMQNGINVSHFWRRRWARTGPWAWASAWAAGAPLRGVCTPRRGAISTSAIRTDGQRHGWKN